MVQGLNNDFFNNYYMMNSGNLDSYMNTNLMSPYNNFGGNSIWSSSPEQMADWNKRSIFANANVNKANVKASNDMEVTNTLYGSPTQVVSRQLSVLQAAVQGNRQENIKPEYDKAYQAIKQMYKEAGHDATDAEIKTYLEGLYYASSGQRLTDDVQRYGHSSFIHGVIQGASFGLLEKKSAAENLSEITGEAQTTGSKVATKVGNALGAVATVAAIPFALFGGAAAAKYLGKGYAALFSGALSLVTGGKVKIKA